MRVEYIRRHGVTEIAFSPPCAAPASEDWCIRRSHESIGEEIALLFCNHSGSVRYPSIGKCSHCIHGTLAEGGGVCLFTFSTELKRNCCTGDILPIETPIEGPLYSPTENMLSILRIS